MSALAASQVLESLKMGDKTLMGDEERNWNTFEDPALKWIEFVEACHTQDPSKVRPFMALAKSSKWTMQLWRVAADPGPEGSCSDSEEDAPWCDACEGPCVCGAEEL